MNEKEISKDEFRSVCQAVGGINAMINDDCKDKDALALVKYISEEKKEGVNHGRTSCSRENWRVSIRCCD